MCVVEQVSGTFLLTDSGIESLAKTCPRLTHVDISGCVRVTRWGKGFVIHWTRWSCLCVCVSLCVYYRAIRPLALFQGIKGSMILITKTSDQTPQREHTLARVFS